MKRMQTPSAVLDFLQSNSDLHVQRLKQWVSIRSISADPKYRPEILKMLELVKLDLENLGAHTMFKDVGMQETPEGEIKLPPVLFAQLGRDPKKKTVCIYGHVDVQPAAKNDGWNTDPFELTLDDQGRMFGRGASDDKGPVLAWVTVIEAFKKSNTDLPVNLKLVIEGMEESGSIGLESLIQQETNLFFKDVDYVCISDSDWLGKRKPCLQYGLRGLAYFYVTVQCARKDLHSGVFGGAVSEAMTDLFSLMSRLVDSKGRILIPGIYQEVAQVTDAERQTYLDLDFDPEQFRTEVGTSKLIYSEKESLLMHRWRYPSLSLHGIEGAFHEPGSKTVIPAAVTGKFSIRLVPDQSQSTVEKLVKSYLRSEFEKLDSPNKLEVFLQHGYNSWLGDFTDPQFTAGRIASRNVFGTDPDLTRDGGSIPVALFFQENLGKSVLLLPMGGCDDATHSQNEKLDMTNFFKGMELFAEYLSQIAVN